MVFLRGKKGKGNKKEEAKEVEEPEENNVVLCEICGKSVKNMQGLSAHLRAKHNLTIDGYKEYLKEKTQKEEKERERLKQMMVELVEKLKRFLVERGDKRWMNMREEEEK